MNKLVFATCTNCSWRSDTPNEIGQWHCHIYTKWYDPKHFCQRHKLLTVEDREKRNYYSKQLMDNIKPSTIAKQFQAVEQTHKNITIRRFEPLQPDQTIKADAGKAELRLVPMEILYAVAIIRSYGNKKYGDPDSWKRVDPERYIDAMLRHATTFAEDPLSVDEESGLPHLWHLACNIAFLCDIYKEALKGVLNV